jgi:hypothetical protein
MLHPSHFGKSLMVTIPAAGSLPTTMDTALPVNRQEVLGLLGKDDFINIMCYSSTTKRTVFHMLTCKMVLIYHIENRLLTNDKFALQQNKTVLDVVETYIIPGCKYDSFFDTQAKAMYYVKNVMTGMKFSTDNVAANITYSVTTKSKATWDAVCGTPENAQLIFSWLQQPNGRPRPVISLLEGYAEDLAEQLKCYLDDKGHCLAMNLATEKGLLTMDLVRYLSGLRSTWETNRLIVAYKIEEGVAPSRAETTANVDLASSLSISRCLPNAVIKKYSHK